MTIEGKEFTIHGARDFVVDPGQSQWFHIDRKVIGISCNEDDRGGSITIEDGSITIWAKDSAPFPKHKIEMPEDSSITVNINDRLRLEVKHVIKGGNI